MIEFKNVCKTFRGPEGPVDALRDFSVTIEAGEFVVARGPSGSGKSTMLLVAGALLRPTSGNLTLGGQDPYALSPAKRGAVRAAQIGFVFQQFHLIPYLSVRDNILAPAVALPNPEAGARADELIDRFGLRERAQHLPAQLSTGERQRTALARAMLNQPKILLADEPTGNLDEDNGQVVVDHLAEFVSEGGTVLMVTHEQTGISHADRILRIEGGKLVSDDATTPHA
ncbi:MAG: ABC transporter ATP-binding protein [Lentisphaerae bacterium]|jgi:putative ABC transport system ATP-binding protein|nr:ABC transporter ATP-binding protein [Lentisphaerota bacterium]MBT4822147.1 ABC transporter ATP-binding protein [Lentisphaerota bacterium]MBT5610713.1 ABC transporter ATP-binding protein [Lentisphaerota bacterium]MBT7054282.1 ABC transporter ATP-binding protein [Lentisphaerota bacterium]MBT7844343.1 ABC transporter ATP-binding protein [Lentisphaerota bacterium]